MFRLSLLIVSLLWAIGSYGVPAKRERCTLTLADGRQVVATWMGDESMHFYRTDDGRLLQEDAQGVAYFVDADSVRGRWQAKAMRRQAARARRQAARFRRDSQQLTGSKRGLVILVDFPDVSFGFTPDVFERYFNQAGYSDDVNIGSVHDYFLAQSYGRFDFTFDVVGPITMPDSLYHYGKNNANGDDVHPAVLVAQVVKLIDSVVDFSQYDWDGDGEVEQIFFIHAGYDEAQSRRANDIWSHAWTLTEAVDEEDGSGPVVADGVLIDAYAMGSELRGRTGCHIAGIGTACHEFTHCFGLPDFYDTNGSNFGMDTWDLMDAGEYNGSGGTPAGFTSYERMFCGWLAPVELTDACFVSDMPALQHEPACYIMRNSGKEDEYFLLENRQQVGWDAKLSGHGMLVLHVDYDSLAWVMNEVNTVRTHQRMTIVPADNLLFSATLAGDPWPGTRGMTELSDFTTPSLKLYNPNKDGELTINHSLTQISETADGLINFIFDEQSLCVDGLDNVAIRQYDDCQIYDLSGRKIENCTLSNRELRGVYIQRSADGSSRIINFRP